MRWRPDGRRLQADSRHPFEPVWPCGSAGAAAARQLLPASAVRWAVTLLRVRPEPRVLCFDNDGGAIFDWLPAAKVVGPAVHRDYFTQPHGLDLVAVARALGLTAEVVHGLKAAATIAAWARDGSGPQVVVAKTDAVAARAVWRDWTGQ